MASRHIDRILSTSFAFVLASGILKGYDALLNLVLDNAVEYLRGNLPSIFSSVLSYLFGIPLDPDDPFKLTNDVRNLGLIVARGTTVVVVCPLEGMEQIANPFIQAE